MSDLSRFLSDSPHWQKDNIYINDKLHADDIEGTKPNVYPLKQKKANDRDHSLVVDDIPGAQSHKREVAYPKDCLNTSDIDGA